MKEGEQGKKKKKKKEELINIRSTDQETVIG